MKYVIYLIGRIRDSVNRFLLQELKSRGLRGLSPSHGDIIGALCLQDQIQMKELSVFINRDKSTITALVNKLIDLGYVKKEVDPTDNRINLISLSKYGKTIKPDIQKISKKLRLKANKDITSNEMETLVKLLSKIDANF